MYIQINKILKSFRDCFSREKTFTWFVIIVCGLIIRTDNQAVTSIVRAFTLGDLAYSCLIRFFHSHAYEVDVILSRWCRVLAEFLTENGYLTEIDGRLILVGDGKNNPVEGRYMPLSKKLTSSSNNNKKKRYFLGHFFGCVGVLAGNLSNTLCIPIYFSIQQCHRIVLGWMGLKSYNHVGTVLDDAFRALYHFGRKGYLVLDRFFLTKKLLGQWRENGDGLLDIIVRAKKNVVAYHNPPEPDPHKRGPKSLVGDKVRLSEFFDHPELFKEARVVLYGELKKVSYYSVNLLWDRQCRFKLRFVLSVVDGKKSVFATTDLKADPLSVIRIYSLRCKIEACFKTFTSVFNGLFYHFWSKAVAKTTLFTDVKAELLKITDPKKRKKIISNFKAIHSFVACSVIAMGIVQLLCLKFTENGIKNVSYQRTVKEGICSEGQMKVYLSRNLISFASMEPDLTISRIINSVRAKYLFTFHC